MIEKCLQTVQLKNFRCFEFIELNFNEPLILIHGKNGSGKTSLLEALHYLCYLRSFRTHIPRDLTRFGSNGFFIKATFNDQEIKVGCVGSKRHIKINQKAISSYQELRQSYRMVTVTEDDIGLVKAGPDKRRTFLDHALLLHKPKLLVLFRAYKSVLENRNALLQNPSSTYDELEIWTKTLWEKTKAIQQERSAYLAHLQTTLDTHVQTQWEGRTLSLLYRPRKIKADTPWSTFLQEWKDGFLKDERFYRRSLFGAHLDDIAIIFNEKNARLYSSRGQQKLIVLLIKIAQVELLMKEQGSTTFLIDDFMTDFDDVIMDKLITLFLELNTQLLFTTPSDKGIDTQLLKKRGAQQIKLSN